MPFLSPNQQCQSTEGKISHSMDLLTPSSPGVFQLCLHYLLLQQNQGQSDILLLVYLGCPGHYKKLLLSLTNRATHICHRRGWHPKTPVPISATMPNVAKPSTHKWVKTPKLESAGATPPWDGRHGWPNKELSWCWQTRVTRLEVSQGHQTWYHSIC